MKKALITLGLLFTLSFGGNAGLGLKSAILPGMGQLSAGNGKIANINTLKGLGIMAGFTISLHGTISAISRQESYAEQTQYYNRLVPATYNEKVDIDSAHQAAYKSWESARNAAYIFGGLTATFYILGIVDALLFTEVTKKKGSQTSLWQRRMEVEFVRGDWCSGMNVKYHF